MRYSAQAPVLNGVEAADHCSARINGVIVESSTRQYYRSKFTRIIKSFLKNVSENKISYITTMMRLKQQFVSGTLMDNLRVCFFS